MPAIIAVNPHDNPVDFNSLFFVLQATAAAANP